MGISDAIFPVLSRLYPPLLLKWKGDTFNLICPSVSLYVTKTLTWPVTFKPVHGFSRNVGEMCIAKRSTYNTLGFSKIP